MLDDVSYQLHRVQLYSPLLALFFLLLNCAIREWPSKSKDDRDAGRVKVKRSGSFGHQEATGHVKTSSAGGESSLEWRKDLACQVKGQWSQWSAKVVPGRALTLPHNILIPLEPVRGPLSRDNKTTKSRRRRISGVGVARLPVESAVKTVL
uniref:HDC04650 n=1 Tax=Drosophila melanogaster TaxID=7227 RepID=Q6IGX2_DROME|nr:TPA_inf: HDC04650 [Drosophila melanogaster]